MPALRKEERRLFTKKDLEEKYTQLTSKSKNLTGHHLQIAIEKYSTFQEGQSPLIESHKLLFESKGH